MVACYSILTLTPWDRFDYEPAVVDASFHSLKILRKLQNKEVVRLGLDQCCLV